MAVEQRKFKRLIRLGQGLARKPPKKVIKKQVKAVRESDPNVREFSGKYVLRAGRISMDRKFVDREAWVKRRHQEQPPPGGWPEPPAHWPPGVRVDIGRPAHWLPDGWGQGVKTTCVSKLLTFVSPEGRTYYHRHVVERLVGKKFDSWAGSSCRSPPVQVAWARSWAKITIAEGLMFSRKPAKFNAESRLFSNLDRREKEFLPSSAQDLYFAVVSARRAEDERGLRNLVNVQAMLVASGASPVWYVDKASLHSYQSLGLNAKVGGKLVAARNLALSDAARAGKPCVQVSDDILRWDYYVGQLGRQVDIQAGNEAAKAADRIRISPGAAARFLLAKLRAAAAAEREATGVASAGPKLAGVFPLGNTGQAFTREAVSSAHFILGDFFVADTSPVRFEPRMTLKEDYDFTCAHLKRHGSIIRCNRMFASAVHETNAGGAVSERDEQGDKERENIRILREKWPGVFHLNGNRGDTQVIMSWKRWKPA